MQKFKKGDLVRIASDLGPSMFHFDANCDAIVIGSYADKYPDECILDEDDEEHHEYTLYLQGKGECSWYYEWQLTLIKTGMHEKLKEWKRSYKTRT